MTNWMRASGALAAVVALGAAIVWLAPGAGRGEEASVPSGAAASRAPVPLPREAAVDTPAPTPQPPVPVTPQFTYLKTTTYSCGGKTHAIQEFRHDQTGLEFVLVPAGQLEKPRDPKGGDGQPVIDAEIASFLMAKTEVPQRVWTAIMGSNPSRNKSAVLPVDSVSWVTARSFCAKTGLALPTEVEWEYACRAGTDTSFYWGDKMDPRYCWLESNAMERTRRVGTRLPNAFGLHDMIGNVYEWCESWFHRDGMSYDPGNDGLRKGERALRVLRGGAAASAICCAFSSSRSGNWAAKATPYDGIRPIARLAAAELLGMPPDPRQLR